MCIPIEEFEKIYKRCFQRAMGLAVTLLHDEEESRDVVQEVFAKLWETNVEIRQPDALVYRSVRNACINLIEKKSTRERLRRFLPLENESLEEFTEERLAAVREAVERLLTEREGEVVRSVFQDGNSYKEAAASLGVSTSAINKHIVNALRKLRNHLNPRKEEK